LDIPIIAAMGENDDSEAIESGRALLDYFAGLAAWFKASLKR
jgi:hypothetical protein